MAMIGSKAKKTAAALAAAAVAIAAFCLVADFVGQEQDAAYAAAEVAYPSAVEGLAYDGEELVGVSAPDGASVTDGGSATSAGTYTAIVELDPGKHWPDGGQDPISVEWSIARGKANVKLEAADVVYDGAEHELARMESSAEVLSVDYEVKQETTSAGAASEATESATSAADAVSADGTESADEDASAQSSTTEPAARAAGTYLVSASIDLGPNYEPVSVSCTTTIARAEIPVPTAAEGLIADGVTVLAGVPEGEGYTVEGAVSADPGEHVAVCTPDANHCWQGGSTDSVEVKWAAQRSAGLATAELAASVACTWWPTDAKRVADTDVNPWSWNSGDSRLSAYRKLAEAVRSASSAGQHDNWAWASCHQAAAIIVRAAADRTMWMEGPDHGKLFFEANQGTWQCVGSVSRTDDPLLRPGDVLNIVAPFKHTCIYVGLDVARKYHPDCDGVIWEASYGSNYSYYPGITDKGAGGDLGATYNVYRYVGPTGTGAAGSGCVDLANYLP